MKPCLILDVTSAYESASHLAPGCERIPLESRPTVLHPDRATAEKEALRLAAAYPSRNFAIFEAAAMARSVDVPTHVSLTGQVLVRGKAPLLAVIGEEGAPF